MTSENGNSMVMPVAPYYGGMGSNGGFFGQDGWWIILLLLVCGGWGNGFGGMGGNGMFPWLMGGQMNSNNDVQRGFDQSAVMSGLNSIQNSITSGVGDIQLGIAGINQNICQTGNGIAAALNNGFYGAEIAANGRQIADMQQNFAIQNAINGGFNATSGNIADLKYTIATESANTRASTAATVQTVMDKLCQLELDGYKRENDQLRTQLNMATLRESQTAQNAFIQQGFSNEVDALYNRLNNCPVPSTPVYGRTPIFTCGGQGCNGSFAA